MIFYRSMRRAGLLFKVIVGLYLCVETSLAQPVPVKMYEKKVASLPASVISLKSEKKNIPADFVKLENKNFTIFYPKCFSISADMDEDGEGVAKAPGVNFLKSDKCDSYRDSDDVNINVGTNWSYNLKSLDSAYAYGHLLLKQKMSINDVDAVLISFARDDSTQPGRKPYLRRELHIICNDKTFRVTSDAPAGDVSIDLINKEKYGFPKLFMEMIATFKCKQ